MDGCRRRSWAHSLIHTHRDLAAVAAGTALGLWALASLMPTQLVLPAVSLGCFASALILAATTWRRTPPARNGRVTARDVAGALALIAFAAGILTEPEHALQAVGHRPTPE